MGEDENVEVQEEQYSFQKGLTSSKQIIIGAWNKCSESRAREMKAGYYNTKIDKIGNAHKIYVEDGRKVFKSCVDNFEICLTHDLDKEYWNNREEIQKKLINCFNIWGHKVLNIKRIKDPKGYNSYLYIVDKKHPVLAIEMPEQGEGGVFASEIDENGREYKIPWDSNYNNYWEEITLLYDKIYRLLVDYIKRNHYFEEEAYTE